MRHWLKTSSLLAATKTQGRNTRGVNRSPISGFAVRSACSHASATRHTIGAKDGTTSDGAIAPTHVWLAPTSVRRFAPTSASLIAPTRDTPSHRLRQNASTDKRKTIRTDRRWPDRTTSVSYRAEQGEGFQPAGSRSFLKSVVVRYGLVKYTGSSTFVVTVIH